MRAADRRDGRGAGGGGTRDYPAVADLVELRIDRFAAVADVLEVGRAIDAVRDVLDPALPILFTFRTRAEGGGADLPESAYRALLLAAVGHRGVAAIDVEMVLPEEVVSSIVTAAHEGGVPVVLSFHDLSGTPSRGEILGRLRVQQDLGADLVKLACAPATPADVLALLAATEDYAPESVAAPRSPWRWARWASSRGSRARRSARC